MLNINTAYKCFHNQFCKFQFTHDISLNCLDLFFIFECHCSSEQISCTIKFTGILLKKIHKPTKHVNINTVTPTNHHFYSRVNNKNWKLLFYRRDHLKLKVNVHLLLKKVKSKIVQVQDSYGWWKCKKCKKTKFSKSNSSDSSFMKTLIPTYK